MNGILLISPICSNNNRKGIFVSYDKNPFGKSAGSGNKGHVMRNETIFTPKKYSVGTDLCLDELVLRCVYYH